MAHRSADTPLCPPVRARACATAFCRTARTVRPLAVWISNQRSRAATMSPERAKQLSAIGMRWS
ncbi:helicase associated domain-containing protein [Streptomyces sp. NPDC005969]|uniref:helicase associated domain-containing protein n=1 Tax=Streptomyces sp. NPDC005969 TaxID=3156722 RepID=UPI003400EC02